MTASPTAPAPSTIPSLDGMRALFFVAVFLSHVTVFPGSFGVTGFFFLSGYLITTLLAREMRAHGSISIRDFYLRRAFRILPPMYLVLVIAVIVHLATSSAPIEGPALTAQALHLVNYYKIVVGPEGVPNGTGVYWSLAVEEHFYLLYPALFVLLWRSCRTPAYRVVVLQAICAAVLVWRLWLVGEGAIQARTYLATDTRVDSLLFGCALALFRNPCEAGHGYDQRWWCHVLLPIGLATIVFTFFFQRGAGEQPYQPGGAFREGFRYTLQGLALYPVFICAIAWPRWGPMRLLNTRWLAYLGTLSYAMYLLHHVVIEAVETRLGHGPMCAVVALGFVVGMAMAIERWIERPLARYRRRFTRHAPAPRAPVLPVLGTSA